MQPVHCAIVKLRVKARMLHLVVVTGEQVAGRVGCPRLGWRWKVWRLMTWIKNST